MHATCLEEMITPDRMDPANAMLAKSDDKCTSSRTCRHLFCPLGEK
jgi:hypothetical protein